MSDVLQAGGASALAATVEQNSIDIIESMKTGIGGVEEIAATVSPQPPQQPSMFQKLKSAMPSGFKLYAPAALLGIAVVGGLAWVVLAKGGLKSIKL